MSTEEVSDVFRQAAELAKQVPEPLRESAFNRALDLLLAQRGITPGTARGRTRRRRASRKKSSSSDKTIAPRRSDSSSPATVRRIQGTGPRSALRQLAATDFFSTPKTIGDIRKHLETKRALRFRPQDLSGHLGFLTREGVLEREKNDKNHYQYRKPKGS